MENDKRLRGVGTALVTPFTKKGDIDFEALERVVEFSIDGGVDFLVALGTTGESPTLSSEEKREVCAAVARFNRGRLPLVMGMGGNDTASLLKQIGKTDFSGYSYILSVAPYYNKPGQRGLYAHFKAVAEASPVPVIVYNIPSRCGANIEPETIVKLAESVPNIAAVKEASGLIVKISEILRDRPAHFSVLSGDDSLTLPLVAMGADGVISTAANLLPKEMAQIVRGVQEGNLAMAQQLHYRISEILKLFFEQGNPPGIKAGLHIRGLCENVLRLPLVPVTRNLYGRMEAELAKLS
ncbi:MAG: 4-hydroxy-tetrahydrodipicolinate synthase [Bacteroidetes bacterium]|uniref:4-hydroxy-tetrahydrodipicolinate synthase n=1 Tax=Candidatus Pullibacteroides excrementavium TaxID=2840905 RepID=A0A9D9H109_9BACT|nr:4-hydroxy-tetrahydrodipicolinate synthase [Candidatus Pullibacteroides excrementavium]